MVMYTNVMVELEVTGDVRMTGFVTGTDSEILYLSQASVDYISPLEL